jgi:mono/diheme cytochrome c family protein
MPTTHDGPTRLATLGLVVLIWLAALGVTASLQTTGATLPPLTIKSLDGGDLFRFYCASCHGRTGAGDGPVAPSLTRRPADLTRLARGNGGAFPRDRVTATIAGTKGAITPAHGPSDMPVWGPIFRALDPDDRQVTVRIDNLVTFIESIQVKPGS